MTAHRLDENADPAGAGSPPQNCGKQVARTPGFGVCGFSESMRITHANRCRYAVITRLPKELAL